MDINHNNQTTLNNKKYIGSCCGNSFVILDCRENKLDRQYKIDFAKENIVKHEVDSVLFLEDSDFDVLMEIFEKDGSESDSCGNGTILIAKMLGLNNGKVEMKDNAAMIKGDSEKQSILMSMKFAYIEKVKNKENCVFVKFGEPHIVFLIDDMENFNLEKEGKEMQRDYPGGVNVDVIQKIEENKYLIKTYERGVFAETKSCGTGSLSAYMALNYFAGGHLKKNPIELISSGGIHWVGKEGNMLRLETLKKFCKIKNLK
ncbi:MAG: hypothetical protein COX29_03790 [Candidatus Moranbacteria bacterium CG23_combo_of_CG06-09_8_20_14_all_35_22]|nr:MAG: hypothetical protein COX29_03790 [Candidatus Moranbacteria bacterium CG23_combo_of_CG06-09_8_20_14_all_35_22]